MSAPVRDALARALDERGDVVLLGEAVGRLGGLWGATAGLLAKHGPERVRDVPIGDRAMTGLALGLALGGKRPVIELESTSRLVAVAELLRDAQAITVAGEFSAPILVRVAYGSEAGPRLDVPVSSLGLGDVPVWCARSAEAAAALVRAGLGARGPVVVLEPRQPGHAPGTPGPAPELVRDGGHAVIVAWGRRVDDALATAEALAPHGYDVAVVDLVRLSPLDRGFLGDVARRTGRLLVAHDGDVGLAEAVVAAALPGAFLHFESPPALVGPSDDLGRAVVDSVSY